ncbi:hypothetical protein [Mycobacterium sp.]|uniref:hypothetical protein n=1 Tax=Mycobacterium sp. TaxID=1785 RepID=UPI002618AC37|nr:hypothetical protein [Mycobacterium sp.]
MDDAHKQARQDSVDRLADVRGAKRVRQPRDLTRLLLLMAVVCSFVMVGATITAVWSLLELHDQQRQLRQQQRSTTVNRKATSDTICKALNANIKAARTQVDTLNGLILGSVRASRAFEDTYRRLGFPDYAHRLANAKQQAAKLAARKPHGISCEQLSSAITRAAR